MTKKPRVGISAAWIGGGCAIAAALVGAYLSNSQTINSHNNLNMAASPGATQVIGNIYFSSTVSDNERTYDANKTTTAPQKEIYGKREFFDTEYGTIALLPDIKTRSRALKTDAFLILTSCAQHILMTFESPIWFQFNNRLPDTNGKRRHLGIFIVTFGRTGATMPLEVYRNKNWVRPKNKKVLGEFSEIVELPWTNFVSSISEWSAPDAQLSEIDKLVKGPWHAIPQGGSEFSWQYREFWKWAVTNCQKTATDVLGIKPNFNNVKVSARLIGYNPTPRSISNSPVLFDIKSMDEDGTAAFIAIYALEDSGQDIRKWYWIKRAN